jgi:hypothetical protein
MIHSTGWFRFVKTHATADPARLVDTTDLVVITETQPDNMINMRGFRGIEIAPFGRGSGAVPDIFVQQVNSVGPWNARGVPADQRFVSNLDRQFIVREITKLDVTLSTDQGGASAGAYVDSSDFSAGIIAQTRTTFGTALESAFAQTSVLFTVGAGGQFASYYLPDVGNSEFIRLATVLNDATHINALVNLYT